MKREKGRPHLSSITGLSEHERKGLQRIQGAPIVASFAARLVWWLIYGREILSPETTEMTILSDTPGRTDAMRAFRKRTVRPLCTLLPFLLFLMAVVITTSLSFLSSTPQGFFFPLLLFRLTAALCELGCADLLLLPPEEPICTNTSSELFSKSMTGAVLYFSRY